MDDASNSTEVSTGSSGFFTPTYANRNMKIYAIPENELEILGTMNMESTMYFSAFSFFISMTLSLFLGGIYTDNLQINQAGSLLFHYGTPVARLIALFFLILGICIHKKRKNMIKTIKQESI